MYKSTKLKNGSEHFSEIPTKLIAERRKSIIYMNKNEMTRNEIFGKVIDKIPEIHDITDISETKKHKLFYVDIIFNISIIE